MYREILYKCVCVCVHPEREHTRVQKFAQMQVHFIKSLKSDSIRSTRSTRFCDLEFASSDAVNLGSQKLVVDGWIDRVRVCGRVCMYKLI